MEPSRKYIVYKQSFQSPLITSRGRWQERTSWVLREQKEDGSISFGEIAPIPDRNDIKTERISGGVGQLDQLPN